MIATVVPLLLIDRPDAPVLTELLRCSPTAAEVAWQPGDDNNEPITDYVVEYNTSIDAPDVRHEGAVVSVNVHSAVIPLRPWANYSFRVSAINLLGVGPASRPTSVVCSTPPAKPLRNPAGVCSNFTGASELIILWQVRQRISLVFRLLQLITRNGFRSLG